MDTKLDTDKQGFSWSFSHCLEQERFSIKVLVEYPLFSPEDRGQAYTPAAPNFFTQKGQGF